MTTGTGVNDGQGPSLPDGAGVAPDESKGRPPSNSPAPVPASAKPTWLVLFGIDPDWPIEPDYEALWRDAIKAVRLLGRQVRSLRAEVEALRERAS